MTHTEYDFHGYTVKQALALVDCFIFNAVSQRKKTKFKFITGRGKIKDELINYIESCGLEWTYPDPGQGCIEVQYLPEEF